MKVVVMCEKSGNIRREFRRLGHEAYSCDLEESEDGGEHICDDALSVIHFGWDLMIAHPPCQHLAVSGARWFESKQVEQRKAIYFFMELVNAPVEHICIENPVCIMSTLYRKPEQIIQPWQFGHPESKRTCLWLKGLPLLRPTKILASRNGNPNRGWDNQTPSGQNKLGPSLTRSSDRARTYQGIAAAMAEQWSAICPQPEASTTAKALTQEDQEERDEATAEWFEEIDRKWLAARNL